MDERRTEKREKGREIERGDEEEEARKRNEGDTGEHKHNG